MEIVLRGEDQRRLGRGPPAGAQALPTTAAHTVPGSEGGAQPAPTAGLGRAGGATGQRPRPETRAVRHFTVRHGGEPRGLEGLGRGGNSARWTLLRPLAGGLPWPSSRVATWSWFWGPGLMWPWLIFPQPLTPQGRGGPLTPRPPREEASALPDQAQSVASCPSWGPRRGEAGRAPHSVAASLTIMFSRACLASQQFRNTGMNRFRSGAQNICGGHGSARGPRVRGGVRCRGPVLRRSARYKP